jgi:betaine-aldehyde dehydrogenase
MQDKRVSLYYDGKKQTASSDKSFPNINPARNSIINQVIQASEEDLDRAVQSAKKAFPLWARTPAVERGRILKRTAELLKERNEEIAPVEVADTGKPLSEASTVDVISGADAIEYFGGIAPSLHGHHYDLGKSFAFTRREPLGICAGIGAWNYPIQIACWKSAPALACGNTMVFKPSELTPRSALILAEIYTEAGLPDGVFNIVQGDAEVGRMLTSHPDISKVSLTGAVDTGKSVMKASAESLKQVTLELGGKSPLVIFADADLEEAVHGAMLANFYTQGEICSNGTRVFVEASIKDAFIDLLIEKTRKLVIGDPMNMKTQVGALISKAHMNKVLHYIEEGRKEARLLYGGNRYTPTEDTDLQNGFFVEPAIFEITDDQCCIATEEIFGPVMSVLSFTSEEEVIRRANSTVYGLAAGVFSKDIQKAHRVVNRLEAGVCWINNYNITPVEIPFGAYKQSGFGRENGLAAIEAYSQLKTIYVEMNKIDSPYR